MRGNSMYTRYYDTYPSSNSNAIQNENHDMPKKEDDQSIAPCSEVSEPKSQIASLLPFGNLGGFKTDDILLIAVLLLILSDCKDDNIMPIILGYILLGGGLF